MRALFLFGMLSLVAVLVGCSTEPTSIGSHDPSPVEGLQEGWRESVELPSVVDANGTVFSEAATAEMWVEDGWFMVRRLSSADVVQWQCALARTDSGDKPTVAVEEVASSLKIEFGDCFVREAAGDLRIRRHRKTAEDRWPALDLAIENELAYGLYKPNSIKLAGVRSGEWCWVTSGLEDQDRPDLWVRMEHLDLKGKGFGSGGGYKPARVFYGDRAAEDDGELFIASRSTDAMVQTLFQRSKAKQLVKSGTAPEISFSTTYNVQDNISLSNLRGKPVLLDFWGTWCGPCVAKLPAVEALHQEFADMGLTVIGVHSKQGSEEVEGFLAKHELSFPIVVDTGQTAKAFGVTQFPSYFLLDSEGKVVESFANRPPTEATIRRVMKEAKG